MNLFMTSAAIDTRSRSWLNQGVRYFASILLLVLALPAFAAPSWPDFFDGDPSQWIAGQDPLPFRTWIRGYETCSGGVDRIFALTGQYEWNFMREHDTANAKATHSQIVQMLEAAEPQCKTVLQRAYWIAALNLGPAGSTEWSKDALVLFGIFLANQNVFLPLTPEARARMAAAKSSPWLTKLPNGDYEISGVYSCNDTSIWIGTELLPYNLQAALIHEMQHLYADKIGWEESTYEGFPIQIHQLLVADEALGAMAGAFAQIDAVNHGFDPGNQSVDDFNFFSPSGAFITMLKWIDKSTSLDDFDFFFGQLGGRTYDAKFKSGMCKISSLIGNAYFKNPRCDLQAMFPIHSDLSLGRELTALSNNRLYKRFSMLLGDLDSLARDLKTPSNICGVLNGTQDKNYLGNSFSLTPGQPANVGVKPCLRLSL